MQYRNGEKNIVGIINLRAIAILLVFIYHYNSFFTTPSWLLPIAKFGYTGVDLFFVISGYLIANKLFANYNLHHTLYLSSFYANRCLKIIPPFFFILLLYFSFPILREKEGLSALLKYLTFTQNYQLNILKTGAFNHAWSICVEMQFYFLFPIFLLIIIQYKLIEKFATSLIILFAIGILVRHFYWLKIDSIFGGTKSFISFWAMKIYFPTYCRLDGLLIGIAIAYLYNFKNKITANFFNKGNYLLAIGVVVLILSFLLCKNQTSYLASVFGFLFISVGYGFIVLAALQPNTLFLSRSYFICNQIATLSYSIYLCHKIILHLCLQYFCKPYLPIHSILVLIGAFTITFLASFCLHELVEKPFSKLKRKTI